MSKLPTVVYPWLGWLFGESRKAIISQGDYERLWEERARAAPQPFVSHSRDQCWSLLHRFAAGSRPGTLDVVQLRSVLSRSRPPVEFCAPEPGLSGPILGTIHASKGREADTVVLVMSAPAKRSGTEGLREGAELEEGRVYYVGATRARKLLVTGRSRSARVSYLSSRRVYCRHGADRAQLEIGRSDDVDRVAHLAWSSAAEVQAVLARSCGITRRVTARSSPETKYFHRLQTAIKEEDGVTREYEIGELSSSFKADLAKLWGIMDEQERLWPAPEIRHLYLIGVTTVGLDERERRAVKEPYRSSGLALAPVVKAFSMIYFWRRKSATRGD